MERVLEALEANDWAGDDIDDAGSFGSFEDGDEEGEGMDPLRLIGDEMGREMFGLHNAIFGDEGSAGEGSNHGETDVEDEEAQVEKLEAMMATMAALKGMLFTLFWFQENCFIEETRQHNATGTKPASRHGRRPIEGRTTEGSRKSSIGYHEIFTTKSPGLNKAGPPYSSVSI